MIRLVTNGKWGVSFNTGTGIEGVELHVYKIRYPQELKGTSYKVQKGDHYGKTFNTKESAEQFAFEHGYLQRFFMKAFKF